MVDECEEVEMNVVAMDSKLVLCSTVASNCSDWVHCAWCYEWLPDWIDDGTVEVDLVEMANEELWIDDGVAVVGFDDDDFADVAIVVDVIAIEKRSATIYYAEAIGLMLILIWGMNLDPTN